MIRIIRAQTGCPNCNQWTHIGLVIRNWLAEANTIAMLWRVCETTRTCLGLGISGNPKSHAFHREPFICSGRTHALLLANWRQAYHKSNSPEAQTANALRFTFPHSSAKMVHNDMFWYFACKYVKYSKFTTNPEGRRQDDIMMYV